VPHALETSLPGVFAAGDVRHRSPQGVSAAVADGATAIRSVLEYLGRM
jgi:thioredoxin reductase (NADPH)